MNHENIFESNGPVVRVEQMRLGAIVDILHNGECTLHTWTQEIQWVQHARHEIQIWHKDVLLETPSGYCDHVYAYMSSLWSPWKAIPSTIYGYRVDQKSTLEIRMIGQLFRTPVIKHLGRGNRGWANQYQLPPKAARRFTEDEFQNPPIPVGQTLTPEQSKLFYENFFERSLEEDQFAERMVWSSRNDQSTNEKLLHEWIAFAHPNYDLGDIVIHEVPEQN